jgi:hypothetical protein
MNFILCETYVNKSKGQAQWLKLIILATQEVEIERSTVKASLGK